MKKDRLLQRQLRRLDRLFNKHFPGGFGWGAGSTQSGDNMWFDRYAQAYAAAVTRSIRRFRQRLLSETLLD